VSAPGFSRAGWLARMGRLVGRRGEPSAAHPTIGSAKAARADPAVPELRVQAEIAALDGCRTETARASAAADEYARIVRPADAAGLCRDGVLVVLADGRCGDAAAARRARALVLDTVSTTYADGSGDSAAALIRALRRASHAIHGAARSDRYAGMYATCTTLVLRQGLAYCAHVGDSRLYLIRRREILLMTEDHTVAREIVRSHGLSRAEAERDPRARVLLRALGRRAEVDVAGWPQPLAVWPDDRFVLCSAALAAALADLEILAIAGSDSPAGACERLVTSAARRTGGAADHGPLCAVLVRLQAAGVPDGDMDA
jgi:PPM family protein phosphatase